MGYRLETHTLQRQEEKQIAVVSCGRQIAAPCHTVPPRVYPSYSLTFVLKGRGTLVTQYRSYDIGAGTGFLIEAGSSVSYAADKENPWEYIFVTFRGEGCPALLRLAALSEKQPLFSFDLDERMLSGLNELLRVSREDRVAGYDALGYFLILVSALIARSRAQVPRKSRDRLLEEAVRYIESNFDRNISVQELSERLFVDRTGVYRLFKNAFGVSPKRYILNYRLTRVARLLKETDVGVSDAALAAGFFDRAHFNKAFRALFGVSPSAYRNAP